MTGPLHFYQQIIQSAHDFEEAAARIAHEIGADPTELASLAQDLAAVSLLSPLQALREVAIGIPPVETEEGT